MCDIMYTSLLLYSILIAAYVATCVLNIVFMLHETFQLSEIKIINKDKLKIQDCCSELKMFSDEHDLTITLTVLGSLPAVCFWQCSFRGVW